MTPEPSSSTRPMTHSQAVLFQSSKGQHAQTLSQFSSLLHCCPISQMGKPERQELKSFDERAEHVPWGIHGRDETSFLGTPSPEPGCHRTVLPCYSPLSMGLGTQMP